MPAPTATTLPITGCQKKVATAYQGEREVIERLQRDIDRVALTALYEDLGFELPDALEGEQLAPSVLLSMDVTGNSTVPQSAQARASVIAKSEGVIAGLAAAFRVFQLVEPDLRTKALCQDGTLLHRTPQRIATVEGSARALLVAERSALNILQRMSGIATIAKRFAEKAAPLGISILDTRKTTPGLRTLEKYAASVGGAVNHRYGLFDAVLIKDNHVRLAGGVAAAISMVRRAEPELPVQVEVTNLDELAEALEQNAEKIILDNMSPQQIRDAVAMASGRSILEISGGVNFDNIDDYLIKGVDAISIGALTHSVCSLDISLEIEV
jgi:nicotinate-nucleotide pyrophosphorylase (carboxylating)